MKKRIFLSIFLLCAQLFAQQNFTQYVNPFIGTGGHGHTYPGATVPFGMVQLSPDNGKSGWDWCSGYNISSDTIVGFSHTHLSGTGIGDLCDILFMPASLPKDADENTIIHEKYLSKFSHNNETASPGYYSVILDDYDIKSELTAALRSGFQKHTFNKISKQLISLDLGYTVNWDAPIQTFIQIIDPQTIAGFRLSKGWANDQRVYFYTKFSKPIINSYLLQDSVYKNNAVQVNGKSVRGIFEFGVPQGESLLIKTGISTVDIDGAKLNLANDIKDWNFDKTRKEALQKWNKELSKIQFKSNDKNIMTTFYTAFYHSMLAPVIYSDVRGNYKGADGKIHKAEGFNRYGIFSLWDTFRAENPLFTIVQSERVADMVKSMLASGNEHGYLPVWELLGNETYCMIGYHSVPVIADAILKGFKGFDYNKAYSAMKKWAMRDSLGLTFYRKMGYIPSDKEKESVSMTLEYAYDDWCIVQTAKYLGNEEDYKYFSARANYYRNLFDPQTGFMRGKTSEGKWITPFDPRNPTIGNHDYTEGNAWQYTWSVQHDVQGLIDLFGGKEKFSNKLDSLFETDSKLVGENIQPDISGMIGQYAHGNEPSHHISYMYDSAGKPWKTQMRVRQIMSKLYNDTNEGLCGNEDCGQMSAWYIFSALGFFPMNPSSGIYVIGSPLVNEATINLGNKKKFHISARNNSPQNIYIRSVKLNGKILSRSYITHKEILNGGTLEFEMADSPDKSLWSSNSAFPPSMTQIDAPSKINKNEYAEKVKQQFVHAWDAYKKYAWGHDQLKPLSKSYRDWYGESLLMTPVDAFDTMELMGLKERAKEAKQIILDNLSFDKDFFVQNFEVTIRLLGGLLSAYQSDNDKKFLDLAEDLGKRLLPAFNSPTGMPYVYVNLKTGAVKGNINNPAECGTLMLEFGTLSKLTGNPLFYEKAKKGFVECFNRRSKIGLVGTQINVETGEWTNTESHISGMIDSYYEYMIKSYLLFGDEDFKKMYDESIAAVNKYLPEETNTGYWYSHVDMITGERTGELFGALDAFMPAMLALSGDLTRAEKLENSCYRMWTFWGIEPEEFNYKTFEITYPTYVLRPEIIESAFYLYRYTKDPRYLAMGKTFYESLENYCRLDEGYAALSNMLSKQKTDSMESFFLAETLKYLYLLFAPEQILDLNKYVFNTEAHPLKIFTK